MVDRMNALVPHVDRQRAIYETEPQLYQHLWSHVTPIIIDMPASAAHQPPLKNLSDLKSIYWLRCRSNLVNIDALCRIWSIRAIVYTNDKTLPSSPRLIVIRPNLFGNYNNNNNTDDAKSS